MFKKITKFITGSRLRNRFLLFFIVLSTVPVLVLGGVSLYLIDLAHKQDVSTLELQAIDQKIREIEKFFLDTSGVLELYVSTDKSYISAPDQAFLLEGLLANNDAFEEVSFVDLEGERRGMETEKRSRYVDGPPKELFIIDSNSEKLKVVAEGKNFTGDVYYTLSGPFATMASPVRNRNGEIISMLSAEVNLSDVSAIIERSTVGISGYMVLVDKNGHIIASGSNKNILPGTDISDLGRVSSILRGGVYDALDKKDRYESFFTEAPVVGAGKKTTSMGWVILAEWPLEEADAVVNSVREQVLVFSLVAILIVLLLAPVFASRLIKPIRELESGARAIEKGDFEKQVNIETDDELEELGNAFNRMAKGLKRLQELKNEFVFVAAHELRTPVTAIKGYMSMLFEGDAGDITPFKKFLEPVQKSSERLVNLVNDLLGIARSEAGRIKISLTSQDIENIIKSTTDEVRPLALEKNISVFYRPASPGEVMADKGKLKEVVMNLLSNAIKYNRKGGSIDISHETKGKFLITHVKDTGIGISKEDKKNLFTKFFRVESKETADISGTGLGLFIVKELVERMNGKIWVKSELGKGSVFSFSLQLS